MMSVAVGLLLLSRAGVDSSYLRDLFPALLLLGLGAGLSFMPLLAIAMHDVPKEDAGLGSGVVNVSMQVAAAVGLAVLGTVATNRTRTLLADGAGVKPALTGGYHLSFLIAAGCVVAAVVAAVALLQGPDGAPADPEELQLLEAENAAEPLTS